MRYIDDGVIILTIVFMMIGAGCGIYAVNNMQRCEQCGDMTPQMVKAVDQVKRNQKQTDHCLKNSLQPYMTTAGEVVCKKLPQ